MRKYGFSESAMKCISSYLSGRKQYVQIKADNTTYNSNTLEIEGGVPQGSVIGSTFFLIFVNDAPLYIRLMAMKEVISKFLILLFADDLLIIVTAKTLERLEIDAYILLNIIFQWARINFQEVNTDKTKLMLISTKNLTGNFRLFMNEMEIERVITLKYLGVLLDEKNKFDHHVNAICAKMHSAIFVLKMLSKFCDKNLLFLVYNSLIVQRFDYCITAWSETKKKNIDRVFKIQKKALRIVLRLSQNEHCKEHFIRNDLLTLPSIVIFRVVMTYVKKRNMSRDSNHSLNTRNAAISKLTKDSYGMRRGHRLFLNLPVDLKKSVEERSFKQKLREFLVKCAFYDENELTG